MDGHRSPRGGHRIPLTGRLTVTAGASSVGGQPAVSTAPHAGPMTHLAIELALLAVMAARRGDDVTAAGHISQAQQQTRVTARRERQLVEIAALVVTGDDGRAAGLALEHVVEFPDDAELLARVSPTS